ncbi:MAG TPA: BamA/TamA family outer membrane protein [Gemmatimonadales bacterium]|nr:BamA/TamA family outer membrane protein [Gemmatimonadales bacterium]
MNYSGWRHGLKALGLIGAMLAAFPPARLSAQDSVIVIDPNAPADSALQAGLPTEVLNEIVAAFADSSALRLNGPLTVPVGTTLNGKVAVYRGETVVAGVIDGPLTVVNGDLTILPGGKVTGPILVAGGRFTAMGGADVFGTPRSYLEAAPVVRQTDGTLVIREHRKSLGELAEAKATFKTGQVKTTLFLATGKTYNRIEGLPIVLGPRFEWRASPSVLGRLELEVILRTASDVTSSRRDVGWLARTDWRFGRRGTVGAGLKAYSQIAGIEEQTLPREEIGWNSFLFQRDYRDYYETEGGSAYLSVAPTSTIRLDGSVRYERQNTVLANDPWSLIHNSDRWRPNPQIDDGHYTTAGLGIEFDNRTRQLDVPSGWWVRLGYEFGHSNDVSPVSLPETVRPGLPSTDYDYSRMTLDARRFNRLTPGTGLNFRLWAGGWVGGDPLPMQRRLSLGGLDMLPGYRFRSLTCTPPGYSNPSSAALCDRMLIFQAEVRSRLDLKLGFRSHDPDRFIGISQANLVFFTNAGKPWLAGDGPGQIPSDKLPVFKEWKADFGAGIDLGGFALYAAKALTDPEPFQIFFRLERRF